MREESVVKDYLTTAADGKGYQTKHYNREAIIAVGYRVQSHSSQTPTGSNLNSPRF